MSKERVFTPYEVFVIAILSFIQFSVILDFMVLSPLGAILMPELKISTSQFGLVVSAYAFSAGAAGILSAGFADRFDRKSFLLFFYTGFLVGTALCAMAKSYEFLLIARIITGIFGGVIGSVSFAIITDLFRLELRGRVMGFVQMSFAASQVLGLPVGLYLANRFDWHAPFWMIVGVGILIGFFLFTQLKPVTAHLKIQADHKAIRHLINTLSVPDYLKAFLCTTLLATGGFMLMPFGSAFSTNNLGLTLDQLPIMYGITGAFSIITGPFVGRLADKLGKYKIFAAGTGISIVMVLIITQLGVTPLWICIALNVVMFVGISSRMISSSALVSAIPKPQDRGAFMSINASVQQVSGGFASMIAGVIVYQSSSGMLERYDVLGYTVVGTMLISVMMMWWIDQHVKAELRKA